MKRLIQFLAIILCMAGTASAECVNAMTFRMESGNQVVCLLDDEPVVKFTKEEIVVTTLFEEIRLSSNEVLGYTLGYTDQAGVTDPSNSQVKFHIDDNKVYFYGMDPDSFVEVYSIAGVLMARSNTNQGGDAVVVIPDGSGDIFVVKTSTINFKLRKP